MKMRVVLLFLLFLRLTTADAAFEIEEASVAEIQAAFRAGLITSRKLVEYYIRRISELNPLLNAVIELNPDALALADAADRRRRRRRWSGDGAGLQGIPVVLKDCIATADRMNTTAGSFALLGSRVPRDAGIVARLRRAGAIILAKVNLSEWMNFRSSSSISGWSARGGQTRNPYNLSVNPCGSSSGSAVAVASNLATVSIGTETDGSILCPSGVNAAVGIKPSVGLTSRAGVVPISHNQDTIGPICRTVADAVEVLDVVVGRDDLDPDTADAEAYIPKGGYKQFLRADGLSRKRLGVLHHPFFEQVESSEAAVINGLLSLSERLGAVIVDNLTLPLADETLSFESEDVVLATDFKEELNKYLMNLVESPVRSLADVIEFNKRHPELELSLFGQETLEQAESTSGSDSPEYKRALKRNKFLTKHGVDGLVEGFHLDALVAPTSSSVSTPAAIAGYPAITIPAGYSSLSNAPFGLTFFSVKGSEPTLIQLAYALEQASRIRKPPPFTHK